MPTAVNCVGGKLKSSKKPVLRNLPFQFKRSISWSKISSGNIAFRYYPKGFIFSFKPFGSKHDEIISKYNIFEFLETSLIFDKLSKLFLSISLKIFIKFSFLNFIFSNLNLLISSKFSDSVITHTFLFFSVVISFTDCLS